MYIGANNDKIWLSKAMMSEFEQCLNQLQFDQISFLANFLCEFGK